MRFKVLCGVRNTANAVKYTRVFALTLKHARTPQAQQLERRGLSRYPMICPDGLMLCYHVLPVLRGSGARTPDPQ